MIVILSMALAGIGINITRYLGEVVFVVQKSGSGKRLHSLTGDEG